MKPIALVIGALVLILQFVLGDYDRADAHLSSFYTEMLSANFTEARKSIDEAIRLWPGNARYYSWRAYCISQKLPSECPRRLGRELSVLDQEAARQAIVNYQRALDLNSRDAVAHHNLAWLEHMLGDEVVAGKDWRGAIAIDPDTAVLHLSYGMFLEESGDIQAGTVQYETAIELSPSILDSPLFIRYRSRSPEAIDSMVARCIARIEDRLRQQDDPILKARLGKLYLYSGKLSRSSQLLQDAAEELPNLPLVWLNLGEVHEMPGDLTTAFDCYRKANVIDGSLAGPYLLMGEAYLRAREKNSAADNLRMSLHFWEHVNPITAAHNNRLYVGPRQQIDDLLPTTLVWYVTPCEASRAWSGLAELFPEKQEYARRTRTCEELPSPHLIDKFE